MRVSQLQCIYLLKGNDLQRLFLMVFDSRSPTHAHEFISTSASGPREEQAR